MKEKGKKKNVKVQSQRLNIRSTEYGPRHPDMSRRRGGCGQCTFPIGHPFADPGQGQRVPRIWRMPLLNVDGCCAVKCNVKGERQLGLGVGMGNFTETQDHRPAPVTFSCPVALDETAMGVPGPLATFDRPLSLFSLCLKPRFVDGNVAWSSHSGTAGARRKKVLAVISSAEPGAWWPLCACA